MKKITIILSSEEPKRIINKSQESDTPPSVLGQGKVSEKSEDAEEEFVKLPKGMFDRILSLAEGKQVETKESDLAKLLALFTKSQRNPNDGDKNSNYGMPPITDSNIDPDDVLTVPAMFFSYSFKYAIYDDVRNGRPVAIPVGIVKFNPVHRSVQGGGRYSPAYSNLSIALVWSKKQVEWLKQHSLFGTYFFENRDGGKNMTPDEQEVRAKAYSSVQSLQGHQLRARCVNEGIKIDSLDEQGLRAKLVDKITKQLMEENTRIKESNVKSMLTEQVETIKG